MQLISNGIARRWVAEHPTLSLLALLSLFFVASLIYAAPSKAAEPGFVFVLFALGIETVVSAIRGFGSIFNRAFFALLPAEKRRVLLLSSVLSIPALGIAGFVWVAFAEFTFQLRCPGGACAQGGFGTLLMLVVAWLSYFAILGLCMLFAKHKWWPEGLTPNFAVHNSRAGPN